METKLKNCPFCGSEKIEIKQTSRNGLKLYCKNCIIGYTQKTMRYDIEWLQGKMIEGWNTRTPGIDKRNIKASLELIISHNTDGDTGGRLFNLLTKIQSGDFDL